MDPKPQAEPGLSVEIEDILELVNGKLDPEVSAELLEAAMDMQAKALERGDFDDEDDNEQKRRDVRRGIEIALMALAASRADTLSSDCVILSIDGSSLLYVRADSDVYRAFEKIVAMANEEGLSVNQILRGLFRRRPKRKKKKKVIQDGDAERTGN